MSLIPALMSGRKLEHDALSTGQFVSYSPANYVELFSDFIQDVGETAVLPWVLTKSTSSGNATTDFIDAPDGVIRLLHTSGDNEVQACLLSLGGTNAISPTKEVIFEARVKITLDTHTTFDADSNYLVFVGMVTAGTAVGTGATVVSATADNVGFQLGSDSGTLSIFCESDDGTNDNDLKDSGIDFVSDTYVTLKIDMTDIGNVRFFVDGVEANNGNLFDMSNIDAADYLEPFILFSRTNNGGTEQDHSMDIDYVKCTWKRS